MDTGKRSPRVRPVCLSPHGLLWYTEATVKRMFDSGMPSRTMPPQRRRGRTRPPTAVPQFLLRSDVAGLVLVTVAVFTLLSLLTGSRGALTGAWIDLLERLTGSGAWLFTLAVGGMGLWLVIRAVDRMPNPPWQRPAGLLLLFLGYILGASLAVPGTAESPAGGGQLGAWIADGLSRVLTPLGAGAVALAMVLAGVGMLTDRLLVEIALALWDEARDVWESWRPRPRPGTSLLQPPLDWSPGPDPWWRRWVRRWLHSWPWEQDTGTVAFPETPSPQSPAREPASTPLKPTSSVSAAQPPPPATGVLAPRRVGPQSWKLPAIDQVLEAWDRYIDPDEEIRRRGKLIEETLALFGVPADFEGVNAGPTVTQYLIRPGYVERVVRGEVKRTKVKVSKIAALANDLALALAAPSVRIEAPIPGTNYVGIEVPNTNNNVVGLRELMESEAFQLLREKARLPIALGEDVRGEPVITDLARMPHLLIAGATGSGKSVCINAIIGCLLLTHTPETLRLLLIDPKMVELTVYNGIPHLLSPVVTDVDRAAGVLFWAVKEMERRYQLLNKARARDLVRYNQALRERGEAPLPYIVVVVDEMADLMMAAPEEVEKHVCRLAQMARAVGIHLIVATQRPSVDVITGLIKANFPARIAFAVTSQTDSRVILDIPGAERLLGRGDMLFMAPDSNKLERLQGAYLSDEEIGRIVRYWQDQAQTTAPSLDAEERGRADTVGQEESPPRRTPPWASGPAEEAQPQESSTDAADQRPPGSRPDRLEPTRPSRVRPLLDAPLFQEIERMKSEDARDNLFDEAVRVVQEAGRASVTLLQRKLRIGYSRASRLMDQLEEAGIVGPEPRGNRGRVVYTRASTDPGSRASQSGPADEKAAPDEDDPPRVWM